MFRKTDPQRSLLECEFLVPPEKAERLRCSWAEPFRQIVLPLINEELFRLQGDEEAQDTEEVFGGKGLRFFLEGLNLGLGGVPMFAKAQFIFRIERQRGLRLGGLVGWRGGGCVIFHRRL